MQQYLIVCHRLYAKRLVVNRTISILVSNIVCKVTKCISLSSTLFISVVELYNLKIVNIYSYHRDVKFLTCNINAKLFN